MQLMPGPVRNVTTHDSFPLVLNCKACRNAGQHANESEERRRRRAGQEQPRRLSDMAQLAPGPTLEECRRSLGAFLGPLHNARHVHHERYIDIRVARPFLALVHACS